MRRKTNEEYLKELKAVWENEYIPQEKYTNQKTKIKVLHVKCNRIYETFPMNLVKGHSCGFCANRILKNDDDFKRELRNSKSTLIPLEKYKGANKKIKFRCKKCNSIIEKTPSSIINGKKRCGYCSKRVGFGNKIKHILEKSNSEYVFIKYATNSDVKARDKYVYLKHKKCGKIFRTTWYHFHKEGTRCPQCKGSKGERAVALFLKSKSIHYLSQKKFADCKNEKCLPFDFYLPAFNMCIEFDGEQHFDKNNFYNKKHGFEYRIKNDKIKNDFCQRNKIKLLRIKYDENLKEVITRALKNRSHTIA